MRSKWFCLVARFICLNKDANFSLKDLIYIKFVRYRYQDKMKKLATHVILRPIIPRALKPNQYAHTGIIPYPSLQ